VKREALFVLLLTVSVVLISTPVEIGKSALAPLLYVHDPLTQGDVSSAAVGQAFTVDIRIADVLNMVGYEFYLKWNTSLLDFISVKEGPFLNSSGAYQSFFVPKYPGSQGWPFTDTVYVADALYAPQLSTSASESGVLARITFEALAEGVGTLDLYSSILVQFDPFTPREITHSREVGYFAYPLPKVVAEPPEVLGIVPGESFNVSINAVNVVGVYNWTLKMRWTASLLNATGVVEESFLSDAGITGFTSSVDQSGGTLYVNATLTGAPSEGVSGNGTLATITFSAETRGSTDLELFDVRLYKQDGLVSPAAVESSSFTNTQRDASIIDSSISSNSVSKGQKVDITVVVKNNGVENETFTVRVDYDSQSVRSVTVNNLVPGATQTLSYEWDTSNVEPRTYTIKATIVETIPGEVNKADNTRTIGTVTVSGGGGIDFNLLLIGGVVAVVVVAAVVGFLFLRRRK